MRIVKDDLNEDRFLRFAIAPSRKVRGFIFLCKKKEP